MKLRSVFQIFLLIPWIGPQSPVFTDAQGLGMSDVAAGISGAIDTVRSIGSMSYTLSDFFSNFTRTAESFGIGRRNLSNIFAFPISRRNISSARERIVSSIFDMSSPYYRADFMLYRSHNVSLPEALVILNASESSNFDPTKETKLIIHDYNQRFSDALLQDIKNAYLEKGEYNVILVDWEQARKYSYTSAATATEYMGIMVARFINQLGANTSMVHVIGFGLGAHTAGIMGNELKGKLRRITGLDPSLPLFRMKPDNHRLDQDDAMFVDVIHTDGGDNFWYANHLGIKEPIGDVDVYANAGVFQPGCPRPNLPSYEDMYCSHLRSLQLFLESITNREEIIACNCDSWENFRGKKCDCTTKMIYVGDSCPKKARGTFYMMTRDRRPFGLGRNGAFPHLPPLPPKPKPDTTTNNNNKNNNTTQSK